MALSVPEEESVDTGTRWESLLLAGPGNSLPEWLGLEYMVVDNVATIRLLPRPECLNFRGFVHGGTLATVADVTMALQATRDAPSGTIPVTDSLQISYLRPAAGIITGRARTLRSGHRRAVVSADLTNESGELVAFASGGFAFARSASG